MDWVVAFLVVVWSGLAAPVQWWALLFLLGVYLLSRSGPTRYG